MPAIGRWRWLPICIGAGGLQAVSLAWPWQQWHLPGLQPGEPSGWLQIASLAVLALALLRARSGVAAFWRGWAFSVAWLTGSFWWLYVSMHTYGGLAAWMAALAVLALAAALSLYYGAATAVWRRWSPDHPVGQAALFAALWTLAELMRGRWFTGFPWGAGGYAQVDLMAAWAPFVGVYGLGAIAALLACGSAAALRAWASGYAGVRVPRPQAALPARLAGARAASPGQGFAPRGLPGLALMAGLFWLVLQAGAWLPLLRSETRGSGELQVWLLQGNIPQNEKFQLGTGIASALQWYPAQVADAARARLQGQGPDLVVAPETAIPLLPRQLGSDFWAPLLASLEGASADRHGLGLLVGLPLGSLEAGYTNSAWGMAGEALRGAGNTLPEDRLYRYDKHHLVPFGEFIPPLFRWFTDLMQIPLGDFTRGSLPQPSWAFGGQRVAPNICYEDLFGEELAASFRRAEQAPTVLVNLSNIGWFGDTVAIDQHLHISRMRALELGRPMLRATNTGATAVIDHTGRVTHQLPRLTRGRLDARVEGREGLTPFAVWASRWGQLPVWGLCLLVLAAAGLRRRPSRQGGSLRDNHGRGHGHDGGQGEGEASAEANGGANDDAVRDGRDGGQAGGQAEGARR